jgi:LysR family transcriptional regulator, glycine cleavage system transcriptional activator
LDFPDPDSLRCFVAAARLSSFSGAARAVGLTPAAVGQRIARLEEQLARPLFARNGRRVSLSEGGLAFLPSAEKALAALSECLTGGVDVGQAPTEIVLGTRHELGMEWIVPLLPHLREALPRVTIHLYFGSGPDLLSRVSRGDLDCAVGSMRTRQPNIASVELGRHDYLFVGSPGLLSRKPLERFEDASRHTLVDIDPMLSLFSYFREGTGRKTMRFERLWYMGTVAAIRSAVLAEQGVAVLPRYLIQGDLDAGRLDVILPDVTVGQDYFRLFHRAKDGRTDLLGALALELQRSPLCERSAEGSGPPLRLLPTRELIRRSR